MNTQTQLTDREVIEACAEICGLPRPWKWYNCDPSGYVSYGNSDNELFNPLTDANDAWLVLEAVRGTELRPDFRELLIRKAAEIDNHPEWRWLYVIGHFSDIARAAAQAWIESK